MSVIAGGMTVNLKMRRFFLDRLEVQKRIGQQKAKSLNRAGTFLRRAGRKLLGPPSKKQRPRPAGKPPRVHSTDDRVSLRNILYFYDPGRDSVICGPVKLNQVNQGAVDLTSLTVPELHEFGGTVLIHEVSIDQGKTWRRRDLRYNIRPWWILRTRRATYPARPTMQPALETTSKRVPELFGTDARSELYAA
jgi:hypothetical protein